METSGLGPQYHRNLIPNSGQNQTHVIPESPEGTRVRLSGRLELRTQGWAPLSTPDPHRH